MSYIYFLTLMILFFEFLFIKKYKEKKDIILWLCISLFTLMAYNSIVIYIFSLFTLKATLLLRIISNIIVGIVLYFFLIRKKEKQKYNFDYKNFIICLLIVICSLVTAFARFSSDLNISFETTDPSMHYFMGELFVESNAVLEKAKTESIYGDYKNAKTMFFSYTNLGSIFEITSPIFDKSNMYKAFIIFEIVMWILGSIIFYYSISSKKMKLNNYILCTIVVLLYMFAYPLTNLIFGFHYLGLGIIVINILFLLFSEFFEEKICNNKLWFLLIMMFAFSVFTSYYLFVPLAFGGCGLFVLYQWLIRKKIDFKQSVKIIAIMLVIPFILGCANYVFPHLLNSDTGEGIDTFNIEGYIYRNLLGNFVYLIPIALFMIISDFKDKKNNPYLFGFIMCTLYIFVVFFMGMNGKSGSYYYYKLYFPEWLFMFVLIGKAISSPKSKNLLLTGTYIASYSFIIVIMLFNIEGRIANRNYLFNITSFSTNITDIYNFNKTKIFEKNYNLTTPEIELVYYVQDNYDKLKNANGEIPFMSDLLKKLWTYSMTRIIPINNYSALWDFYGDVPTREIVEKDDSFEYIVTFYRDNWYVENKDNLENFEIVYKNDGGMVLKKSIKKEVKKEPKKEIKKRDN